MSRFPVNRCVVGLCGGPMRSSASARSVPGYTRPAATLRSASIELLKINFETPTPTPIR
jgi:hypothetical protein